MEYVHRIADGALRHLLTTVPVVTIEGARATGKTTSASRLAAAEFRLPRDLALLESDPERVLREARRPTLIDEWQLAGTDVLWVIKDLVDENPAPGSFILTGSVEPEAYGPTYPLTGRGVRISLRPMSHRERLGRGASPAWLDRLRGGDFFVAGRHHDATDIDVVARTGFPAATPAASPASWLRAYARSVAERSIEEQRDPERVGRLLRVLAELEGNAVPDELLWRSADINRETLHRYTDMLTRAHITTPLPAWDTNRLKRITAYPKRHLVDSALALAVAGIGVGELQRDPALAGRYLESFVAEQIRPESDVMGATMSHLRTRGGEHEIDLIIDLEGELVALEVKATTRPKPADAKHLRWLVNQVGSRVSAAAVLHRGDASFELVPGVWALPIASLWT